jgi:hypothetical protein
MTSRMAGNTRRRVDLDRARRLLWREADRSGDGDAVSGTFGALGRCVVRGPLRLDCGLLLTTYDESGTGPRRCGGILSARQRADGLRLALLRARRGSHCLKPAS